jgi:CBS domain-containing protein
MSLSRTAVEAKRYGVFTCENCTTLGDAARRMVEEDISSLVIIDANGGLAGILSRIDIIRAAIHSASWSELPIEDYANPHVVTVTAEATLRDVAAILLDHHIHRVVVVREENGLMRPISVISAADIVYHLNRESH